MMSLINGKDFFEGIRKNDIEKLANGVLVSYANSIIRSIIYKKYCKLAFGDNRVDNTCFYTDSWQQYSIFGDPVAALKDCLIQLNYNIKSEIIADRHTDATKLKEHYRLINKSYKPDHLVIGYEFTLKEEEEKKREKEL